MGLCMFRKWLNYSRRTAVFPSPDPETSFVVLGDIHGRADLLQNFLNNRPEGQIICVGDYIDRGENSAEVLQLLQNEPDIICLSGNHEEMMLRFLEDPVAHGARWLRNGGLQTLASFLIYTPTESAEDSALKGSAQQLRNALGEPLLQWLRSLPTIWQTGNVAVVHAGADPAIPMSKQRRRTLHWGRPDFLTTPRTDGIWIVHGHTIVDQPVFADGRISIDTGAYATGRLSAVRIEADTIDFEQVPQSASQ